MKTITFTYDVLVIETDGREIIGETCMDITMADPFANSKELWQKKLDDLPGDTVSVNHSVYKMASHAATKYATAKYMYKLMSEQDAE